MLGDRFLGKPYLDIIAGKSGVTPRYRCEKLFIIRVTECLIG